FYGGGLDQLWRQAVGAVVVLAYSFVVSLLLALLVRGTVGFRITAEAEDQGIDEAEHAESAYSFTDERFVRSTALRAEKNDVELEGSRV
ncbi:hypothetical protein LH612_33080, partial [Klebsiella pneumoniae]|nr:hypothetical protein [Klebsiella pneumoniae]